ncbi:MAG: hypothetical protein LBU82_08950 [Treponema sp.]|jgi:hypothetical protein|nr:hypothetical protein [Treponema sp.]
MGSFLQTLLFTIVGVFLLWFGYSLFFGKLAASFAGGTSGKKHKHPRPRPIGTPGDPQVCPVCSSKLYRGELVKSVTFPSMSGGRDRLMYIRGCFFCLNGDLPRYCPVCGNSLGYDDYLIARMFERHNRHNHVHVLGCNFCKKAGKLIK